MSACTFRHERLLRRSVSLHPYSSWALHACPSLGLDDRRLSTALVSVLPWSREDSRATHRAHVESRRARGVSTLALGIQVPYAGLRAVCEGLCMASRL